MRYLALALLTVGLFMFSSTVTGSSPADQLPSEEVVQEIVEVESEAATENWPTFSERGEKLVARMRDGFVKNINKESAKWYECGELTPPEEKEIRAEKIARYTLDALREYDLDWLNPWAVLAVIYRESRGDQCAIGPHSRRAAIKLNLVDEKKPWNRWSKEDIEAVFNSKQWQRSRGRIGADLGLGQQVWKRYARILDPEGKQRCSKKMTCRVPTLEEILSVEYGPKVVATGMLTRHKSYRTTRPWEYWPGSIRSIWYDQSVLRIVTSLGGGTREKPVW